MSNAAEHYVKGRVHPKLKGGARALLVIIAQHVPEGETTTPPIGMEDLARHARLHRSTVWRRLELLVELGELQVIDRAPGRVARYHLVHLAGPAPLVTSPLPLLGAAPRPARPIDGTMDLFASPSEERAINLLQNATGSRPNLLQKITGWGEARAINLLQKITGWFQPVAPVAKRNRLPAPPTGGVLPRARDVHTSKNVHTHTAAVAAAPPDPIPIAPPATCGPWHAWCAGRVHVPAKLHREFLAKIGRLAGESDAAQDARLIAWYVAEAATLSPTESITENDFVFWRRRFAAAFAKTAGPPGRTTGRADGPPSPCGHDTLCESTTACIQRTLREARERKSG